VKPAAYSTPAIPGSGEYLIRVGAAGVNFADVMQSRGIYDGGPQALYVARPRLRSLTASGL
jgi:NADPH:quinone reductase-like Zn-dependent oxidoreductase